MMDFLELANTPCGAYTLSGMMVAFPIGYAFAMRTVLKQAKEIIDDQKKEIEFLKQENKKYIEKLIN